MSDKYMDYREYKVFFTLDKQTQPTQSNRVGTAISCYFILELMNTSLNFSYP